MNTRFDDIWKAKLKAALEEQRHWAKRYNEAERAMLRIGKTIEELEAKLELADA